MEESERTAKEQDIEDFVQFLEGKTAKELVEIYRTMSENDFSDQVQDKFDDSMKRVVRRDQEFTLQVARLLIHDTNPELRLETFWILQPLIFVHPEARSIVWEQLLSDEDPVVFEQIYGWLRDDISSSEDAPLTSVLYAATWLNKAKARWDSSR